MSNEELESQLSAMFDDELPAPECELLARRLARDEQLRRRWGHYAAIGACIRGQPGVQLETALASKVSAAVKQEATASGEPAAGHQPRRFFNPWLTSVAGFASAAAVAALAILWMRAEGPARLAQNRPAPPAVVAPPSVTAAAPAPQLLATVQPEPARSASPPLRSAGEPDSYVTPAAASEAPVLVPPTELANYIVAHSVYSGPLMRRNALSALVGGDAAASAAQRPTHRREGRDRQMIRVRAAREPMLWLVMSLVSVAAVAADTPQSWLDRMNDALTTRNYDGVFSHWQGGQLETLRIVHRVMDGLVTERLESLDGSGRQFVSDGAVLTCYLPDQRTVLVEKAPASLLSPALPKFEGSVATYYQLASLGTMRQMGEKTQVITVTPRDGYRYGYRLWIQRSTGMPLKTELLDTEGNAIEQVVFSSLSMRHHIADAEFKPQLVTTGFQWLRDDGGPAVTAEGTGDWNNTPLPPGFRLTAQTAQMMPGVAEPVTHLVFSDGLATVSAFIQTEVFRNTPNQQHPGVAQVGTSSAFTSVQSGHKFVALGEVPPATVQLIIQGLMRQSSGQAPGLPQGPK